MRPVDATLSSENRKQGCAKIVECVKSYRLKSIKIMTNIELFYKIRELIRNQQKILSLSNIDTLASVKLTHRKFWTPANPFVFRYQRIKS